MSEAPEILVNGLPADGVSAVDRGLQYGDGLFETIAVIDGRPQHWSHHWRRLVAGCQRLGLPVPDQASIENEIAGLVTGDTRVLKLIVTRGRGGRGYRPPAASVPTRILSVHPCPDYPPAWRATGVTVRLCNLRLGRNPALAGVKHLNRLEQVMARHEWDDPGIAEGLMFDSGGLLIEGTMSNAFLVRDGRVCTPALDQAGVAGVMREIILETCPKLGIPAEVGEFDLEFLLNADEVFLSNSVIGLWPVRALAGDPSGNWEVGPMTSDLMNRLAADGALPAYD
jgi:4-amino-4-deoxychorismate lyase